MGWLYQPMIIFIVVCHSSLSCYCLKLVHGGLWTLFKIGGQGGIDGIFLVFPSHFFLSSTWNCLIWLLSLDYYNISVVRF
jgi:hypothetical protein